MPGLTLYLNAHPDGGEDSRFASAQALMLHRPSYRAHSWVRDSFALCGHVSYPEYPIRSLPVRDGTVVVEGRIYNKPRALVDAELRRLSELADGEMGALRREVRSWIEGTQGSYLVLVLNPTHSRVLVFSDPFGRLPTYFAADGDHLIVSREVKFIRSLLDKSRWDPVGWAQWLSLGLPIGRRTLHANVESFPDGGMLVGDWGSGQITSSVESLVEWNLDDQSAPREMARLAGDFVDLLVPACRDWGSQAGAGPHVVSLSGGHDSRFVVAGMVRAGIPVQAITYDDPNGRRKGEVVRARQLTAALGVPWSEQRLPSPTDAARRRLVWLKDGLNWSTMGYILAYLESIVEQWGAGSVYLTGDGGNDCLNVLAPTDTLRNLEAASRYVADDLTEIPAATAERLLRLPPGTVLQSVREQLATYPEDDFRGRIKHYKILERGRRCYFEGEDRTRFFLWQDSPFYSLPLYRYCMRVPDARKAYNAFARHALAALSPAAARVPVFPLGVAPASLLYPAANRLQEAAMSLPDWIRAAMRVVLRRPPAARFRAPDENVRSLVRRVSESTPIQAMLDPDVLEREVPTLSTASQFYLLWSLVHLDDPNSH